MSVKAILFDLDDTLVDHRFKHLCGLNALREMLPPLDAVPPDDLEREYERIALAVAPRTLDGSLSAEEAGRERMRLFVGQYGLQLDPGRAGEASDRYDRAYRSNHRAIPGALDLLRHLARTRVKAGLVTNGPVATQSEKVRASGIEGLLDAAIISEAVGVTKPDRAIFEEALRRVDTRPRETVFVGDNWTNDILGAHACGIRAVWLNRYGRPCPDAAIATEITALEPLDRVLDVLFHKVG